jgi:hypothetical protein
MASKGFDRSPKEHGSTHCLKNATHLGGEVIANGMDSSVEDYNPKSMVNSSKAKFFRGAGGSVSMDNASSSIGGKIKS